MFVARPVFAMMFVVALSTPLAAKESGNFVVRLGRDTTAVEHYTRSANHLEIDQVGRAPRVYQRHIVYDFAASGTPARFNYVMTMPGAAAGTRPAQTIDATFTADSIFMNTRRDTSLQVSHVAVPAGAVVITNASPWSLYEGQTMRLAGLKADSLHSTLYYLGAPDLASVTVRRLGRDSMVIETSHDLYHARVDRQGRILNIIPIVGTAKYTVDRVASLDLPAMTASFAAREQQSGAMGVLSPRDTVRANLGGATLWIDYGRPSKRGRVVYGGIVPWGEVWRTGANAATQFRTDKALQVGTRSVPAGFYTLWTIPSPTGWKLVINGETGQWGTAHKVEKDLYTLDMKLSTLPEPVERFTISVAPGGAGSGAPGEAASLNLDWDLTRASLPFTVVP